MFFVYFFNLNFYIILLKEATNSFGPALDSLFSSSDRKDGWVRDFIFLFLKKEKIHKIELFFLLKTLLFKKLLNYIYFVYVV